MHQFASNAARANSTPGATYSHVAPDAAAGAGDGGGGGGAGQEAAEKVGSSLCWSDGISEVAEAYLFENVIIVAQVFAKATLANL